MMQTEKQTAGPMPDDQGVSLNLQQQSGNVLLQLSTWIQLKKYHLVGFLLLVSLLYLVVFILPQSVPEPDIAISPETLLSEQQSKPIDESPWHEAQLAKHRKESQLILEQVLEQQKLLESKQVKRWAKQAYQQALDIAAAGDLSYRQQDFDQAKISYQSSLNALQSLVQSVPEQFAKYLEQGQQALQQQDSARAREQLQIALYLDADNHQAQQLMAQAEVLDQVLALVKQGKVLLAEQQLPQAQQKFQAALALDRNSSLAKRYADEVHGKIVDQHYSSVMSKGYAELATQHYAEAIQFFKQAQAIKPGLSDASAAITQAQNEGTQQKISVLLKQGQQQEQNEQWPQAKDTYQAVLALDKSLIAARVGELRSNARAVLDQQLDNIITQPMRLTDAKVYNQAQQTYQNALKISSPGVKLQRQLTQVQDLLQQVLEPITLNIQSDNLTLVRIFRVGELGRFASKSIDLKPGEYTVIGTRDGYRDVQQRLNLAPAQHGMTITIQCQEKVSNG